MSYRYRKDYSQLRLTYLVKIPAKSRRPEESGQKEESEQKPTYERRSIEAKVESIDLHLFDNSIGLLSITTSGKLSFDRLLLFNDMVRRICPPFLELSENNAGNTAGTKEKGMLADEITLTGKKELSETFPSLSLSQDDPGISRVIASLLMPFQLYKDQNDSETVFFSPFTDDRMFVVCYLADPMLSWRMASGDYPYRKSDQWYQYIFVDGMSPGIANEKMKGELLEKHTYARWAEYGTLYGMTRYSLVCLSDGKYDLIKTHMKSVYYQMAIIVLIQRAMLLHLSERVNELTKSFDYGSNHERGFYSRAAKLHGDFIKFTNKYWFTEISPQEQGIEMYRMWRKLLDHDYLYEKLKDELFELSEYVENRIEHETNQGIANITKYGFPISIIVAVWTIWLVAFGEGIPNVFGIPELSLRWVNSFSRFALLTAFWGCIAKLFWDSRKSLYRLTRSLFGKH
jgi:hypothetical protein